MVVCNGNEPPRVIGDDDIGYKLADAATRHRYINDERESARKNERKNMRHVDRVIFVFHLTEEKRRCCCRCCCANTHFLASYHVTFMHRSVSPPTSPMTLTPECISFCTQCIISLLTDSGSYTLDQVGDAALTHLLGDTRLLLTFGLTHADFMQTVLVVSTDPTQRSRLCTLTVRLRYRPEHVVAARRLLGRPRHGGGALVDDTIFRSRCRDLFGLYATIRAATPEQREQIFTITHAYTRKSNQ